MSKGIIIPDYTGMVGCTKSKQKPATLDEINEVIEESKEITSYYRRAARSSKNFLARSDAPKVKVLNVDKSPKK